MSDWSLLLRTDLEGTVEEVLLDRPGLGYRPGEPLAAHLDPGSHEKAAAFLRAVRRDGHAVGWQLAFETDGTARVLSASGGRAGSSLVCVAGPLDADVSALAEAELRRSPARPPGAPWGTLRELVELERRRVGSSDALDQLAALHNELVGLQREVAGKNARLSRANEEKNRLLGAVAHDLRNPLGSVLGYTQLLLEGAAGEPSPGQRKILRTIERLTREMATEVESLVDLSAIGSGRVRLALERYDLVAQLRADLESQRLVADQKPVTLELAGEPSLRVRADRSKIRQVVQNLVDNAIKYSHPGGHVTVTASREDGLARVAVRDEGIGIGPDDRERIFEPLVKGATAGTAGEKSTGFGLAIAERIAAAHDGRIEVESELDRGSTFTLRFPFDGPG